MNGRHARGGKRLVTLAADAAVQNMSPGAALTRLPPRQLDGQVARLVNEGAARARGDHDGVEAGAEAGGTREVVSDMSLIDLAGLERNQSSGATGDRLKEAAADDSSDEEWNGDDDEVEDGDGQADLHLPLCLPGRHPGPRCPHIPPRQVGAFPHQSYCLEKLGSSLIPILPHRGSDLHSWPQSRRPDRPFSSRNANLDSTSSSLHLVLPTFGVDILFLLFIANSSVLL